MNGKGDKRRPCLVSRKEYERNWRRIFIAPETSELDLILYGDPTAPKPQGVLYATTRAKRKGQ